MKKGQEESGLVLTKVERVFVSPGTIIQEVLALHLLEQLLVTLFILARLVGILDKREQLWLPARTRVRPLLAQLALPVLDPCLFCIRDRVVLFLDRSRHRTPQTMGFNLLLLLDGGRDTFSHGLGFGIEQELLLTALGGVVRFRAPVARQGGVLLALIDELALDAVVLAAEPGLGNVFDGGSGAVGASNGRSTGKLEVSCARQESTDHQVRIVNDVLLVPVLDIEHRAADLFDFDGGTLEPRFLATFFFFFLGSCELDDRDCVSFSLF